MILQNILAGFLKITGFAQLQVYRHKITKAIHLKFVLKKKRISYELLIPQSTEVHSWLNWNEWKFYIYARTEVPQDKDMNLMSV